MTADHSRSPLYVCLCTYIITCTSVPRGTLYVHPPRKLSSAAAAGAAAAHALVATAVADHDGAAERATGSVSHVDHAGEGVGGVDGTRSQVSGLRCQGTPRARASRAVQIADPFRERARTWVAGCRRAAAAVRSESADAASGRCNPRSTWHSRSRDCSTSRWAQSACARTSRRAASAERRAAARWMMASEKLSIRPETVEPSLAILMKISPGSPLG